MITIVDWYDTTIVALLDLWRGFIVFIPKLIGALVIFLIGWIIAVAVGKLIAEILKKLNFNKIFDRGGMKEALEKADFRVDASSFIGAIFKWVLVMVFLLAAVEVLGFVQFADFLTNVLNYLPNVVVSALIFVVAVIITDILEKIVRAGVESVKVGYGNTVSIIVRWSIWVFAVMAILYQLNVAPGLVDTMVKGIVGFMVIAAGLAFGLGGKDVAADILRDLKKKLER